MKLDIIMLNVVYAEYHLCRVSFIQCHLCTVLFMPSVIYAYYAECRNVNVVMLNDLVGAIIPP
jgi:hypothetical protein